MLSDDDKQYLLRLARDSMAARAVGERLGDQAQVPDSIRTVQGAFVSLHKAGQLRGCIGYVEGIKPLWQAVGDLAVEASAHDPRFEPVKPDEVGDIDIEISVLSPPEPIRGPDEVKIGTHGLIVRSGGRSGLLLPQVATQYNWGPERFLEQTCWKAGLPLDTWRSPKTELLRFSATVFGERSMGLWPPQ
ncbi:MAG: AmmeMemoRadiSam system protein A [Verrucomicrobia bacterium]|nr:AmmeMemoRadiSam system protein A [Verrucomicrobiota bacterium]